MHMEESHWGCASTLIRLVICAVIIVLATYVCALTGSSLSANAVSDTTNARWESWGAPPTQVAKILDSDWHVATIRTVDSKAYYYNEHDKRWIETDHIRTLTGGSPCPKIPPAPVKEVNSFEFCTSAIEIGPLNAKYVLGEDGKIWAWRNHPNDHASAFASGLQWGALLGFLIGGGLSILIWKIRF